MATVETQAHADALNASGEFGPYRAANGHLMVASLRFPTGPETETWPNGQEHLVERDYRVGDTIRYDQSSAWCAPGCSHAELGPLEDW